LKESQNANPRVAHLNSFQFEYNRLLPAASTGMFERTISEIDSFLVLFDYLGRGFVVRQVKFRALCIALKIVLIS
jgi:hypothetical protein